MIFGTYIADGIFLKTDSNIWSFKLESLLVLTAHYQLYGFLIFKQ